MGLFDFLTGNADPDPSIPAVSADELRRRLLALKDPNDRWHVRETHDDGAADLVAEWSLSARQTIEWVQTAGAQETKRVLMRLVPEDRMVRSVDHDGELAWDAGLGGLHFEASASRGQSRQIGGSWDYGPEGVTKTSWDSDEIKQPLRQTVAEAGWGWHGVAFAKL